MNLPSRPHFVISWVNVGAVDPEFAILNRGILQENSGLYLFFSGKRKIQYIGIAYSQSLGKRIGQHLQGLRRLGGSFSNETHLYVGLVDPKKYKRLSRKMVEEIESFLVWAIRPEGNTAKLKPYRGREMLIHNVGDGFGLPSFLYVQPLGGPFVVVGQGESIDQMRVKTTGFTPSP